MPVAAVNGISVAYEDSGGTGTPVVLIHGHSVDLRMWPRQYLALREAGYRVIRYDVRGHGRSSAPAAGYTWPEYSADLRALLDHLDVARAHVAGFSMGGGIALQFALDNPGRVLSLALMDAAVPGFVYSDAFATTIEALVRAVRAEGWRSAAQRLWLTHPMFAGLRRHPAMFDVVQELVLAYPARDYQTDQPEPAGPEVVDRLHTLRPPVLVMVGAEDLDDFLLAAQVVAANAPHARLEIVPDAGHMLPLERPEETNRRLLAFLMDPQAATAPAPADITVRQATSMDIGAMAELNAAYDAGMSLRLERRGAAPELTFDFAERATAAERTGGAGYQRLPVWWQERLQDGDLVLVATVDGDVAGSITLQDWEHAGACWIADLRVDVEARRHGLGRLLIESAAIEAQTAGRQLLRTEVTNDNLGAVRFLLACGFRFSGFDDQMHAGGTPVAAETDTPVTLFFTRPVEPRMEGDRIT